ncbi:MAG: exodeoxyribonuclease VII large subunit [Wenzhouxiangella sp.]|nr:MAG: exodeoxyribonuclease VII large subunit [Wenzhouxiangella sp.]
MPVQPPGPESRVYVPQELNQEVRLHLEAGFPRLWIQAEISNLARPASGHLYFTLKDARAQIRCALFKSSAAGLGFRPENGQEVLVRGRLSLYEARGDYQLIADGMLEAGAGVLARAFEALKKKLEAEGLFDPAHKQVLPAWPRRIGLITSPSGAALQDMLRILHQRWPAAKVRVYASKVQGEQAPAELTAALKAADRQAWSDVIIIGRGGGSLEDLWAFNDENLARAIFAARTPIVSAVGHETDFTIADFVADLRAATPTAAAAAVSPDGPALRDQLARLDRRLARATRQQFDRLAQAVDHLAQRLNRCHPGRRLEQLRAQLDQLETRNGQAMRRLLIEWRQRWSGLHARLQARHPARELDRLGNDLSGLDNRLRRAVRSGLDQRQQQLAALVRNLDNVSPLRVLERGYGVVRDPNGKALTREEEFIKGNTINILMSSFEVDCEVIASPRKAQLE